VARAFAVEIDIVPGRPAACGALIGVNFWVCGFFGGRVVFSTYLGLISGGLPLGVGPGVSSGVKMVGAGVSSSATVVGAGVSSSMAVDGAPVSSSVTVDGAAVNSGKAVGNSLSVVVATIGASLVAGEAS